MQHYVLDLSRLISSAARPAPTGIDRVELAYAREFLTRPQTDITFAAMTPWRRFGLLDSTQVAKFIVALTVQWYAGGKPRDAEKLAAKLCRGIWLRGERALYARLRRQRGQIIYLNVSHHHLDRPETIVRLKTKSRAAFVPMVYDLIPIEFPEYARPYQDEIHRRRIATVANLADAVIVISEITRRLLKPKLTAANRSPPVLTGTLGIDLSLPRFAYELRIPRPYFICVGTIEPRKNHLLLLKLWRRMSLESGLDTPHLVIVGRRGWENENIVDMLDRCPSLRGIVHEFSSVTDSEVCGLIQNACAMLMPSFSEGYGLPVIEALAMGVPAICSDIPAHREAGGTVAEFLDPMDGPAWHRAIIDYAAPNSIRRAAQIIRLRQWSAPTWQDHFELLDTLLKGLSPHSEAQEPSAANRLGSSLSSTEPRTLQSI